ncbi:PTS sugar transporter subunit IIB [Floccifex sp.]|uniref:PTS sugar transporter subunit IIB n=1 Tax=Floccifex sp. TaxID=2815810 RepID=UPI002A754FFD|nr:PTS sugar transporter subunit IIB [Floccifex sp.]MDD7281977.1 PTS sugar transporter subunit IIB [Erysipelotrichaceae bacterium]MDY2957886.1 PTS sugar transporter subunit IIB [Floccifex sp.]
MAIRSIMCCCGQGLGSSMIVSMNVERALKNLGISGVSVDHTSLNEISPNCADLFVVGADLAPQLASYPNKIILEQLMDMNEITTKLKEVFDKQ